MVLLVVIAITTVFCQASAQCVGQLPAYQKSLIPNQVIGNPSPCNQVLAPSPVYATTIIDNSVSNSLANALQLLIVSDLIDATLNARNVDIVQSPCLTNVVPAVEAVEVVSEYISPCGQNYGPVIDVYQTPCVESYEGPVIDTYYGGLQEIMSPMQVSPCAAEVLFPSSIPAQLTCNFGYVPSTVPVVSVNVEPLGSFGPTGAVGPSFGYGGNGGFSGCGGNGGYGGCGGCGGCAGFGGCGSFNGPYFY